MKITNENRIKNSEKELINAIINHIDWGAVEAVISEKHKIGINGDIRYGQGDMAVHNGRVVYRVNFDVTVPFSILFDRDGEYVSINTSQGSENTRPRGDDVKNEKDLTENEILEKLTREMDALEEEEPIELTDIVGNLMGSRKSVLPQEESVFHAAVNE